MRKSTIEKAAPQITLKIQPSEIKNNSPKQKGIEISTELERKNQDPERRM
jgi:hypothetical protein